MPDTNKHKKSEPHPFGNTTRSFSLLLCLGALAGVLIWAKLRLVTDIPRSAYADPRENDSQNEGDRPGSSTDDAEHESDLDREKAEDDAQP